MSSPSRIQSSLQAQRAHLAARELRDAVEQLSCGGLGDAKPARALVKLRGLVPCFVDDFDVEMGDAKLFFFLRVFCQRTGSLVICLNIETDWI